MENVDHQTEEVLQQLLLQIYVTQGWQVLFLEQDHGIGHAQETMEEVQQIVQQTNQQLQSMVSAVRLMGDYSPLCLILVSATLAHPVLFLEQDHGIGHAQETMEEVQRIVQLKKH